jgi:hypothetical protein
VKSLVQAAIGLVLVIAALQTIAWLLAHYGTVICVLLVLVIALRIVWSHTSRY